MGLGPSLPSPHEIPAADRAATMPGGCTLAGFAQLVTSGKMKNIVVLAGAGLSVSAGIPDFRSPGTGLYHNLQKYKLSCPTDVFDIEFFKANPQPFFHLARELYPGRFAPTQAHRFLQLLDQKGVLLRVYTQNIDTLERQTGISPDKLIEAHGSFASSTCTGCKTKYSQKWMEFKIFGASGVKLASLTSVVRSAPDAAAEDVAAVTVPLCDDPACNSVVKPDITFFGEDLPEVYGKHVKADCALADGLIVIGTSLTVFPVASIPGMVSPLCPRLLINREAVNVAAEWEDSSPGMKSLPTGEPDEEELMRRMQKGSNTNFRFFLKDNYRDVLLESEADAGTEQLARELGWRAALHALHPASAKSTLPTAGMVAPPAKGSNYSSSVARAGGKAATPTASSKVLTPAPATGKVATSFLSGRAETGRPIAGGTGTSSAPTASSRKAGAATPHSGLKASSPPISSMPASITDKSSPAEVMRRTGSPRSPSSTVAPPASSTTAVTSPSLAKAGSEAVKATPQRVSPASGAISKASSRVTVSPLGGVAPPSIAGSTRLPLKLSPAVGSTVTASGRGGKRVTPTDTSPTPSASAVHDI